MRPDPVRGGRGPLFRVLFGQGATSLTSFATVLALGRWGGEADLGQYALGWSCWFLAQSLSDTLVSTPYTFFRAQARSITDDLSMSAVWGVAALCCCTWVALTAAWWWEAAGVGALWPALPCAVCAALIREFARRHLLATDRSIELMRIDGVGAALQLGGVLGLSAMHALSASSAYWVMAAAALTVTAPLVTSARLRRLARTYRQARGVARAFLGYGHWLLLGGLCHVASVQAYPWLALSAGGERMSGLFAASVVLLNVVSPLLTGLTNFYRPRFMHARIALSDAEFIRYALRIGIVFAAPVAVLAVVLFFGGKVVLHAVYGAAFVEAADALPWLGLGTVAMAIGAPLQLALLAQREPSANLIYHGSALLLLACGVVAVSGAPSLVALGQIQCAVNAGATAVLAVLFELKCRRRR